MPYGTVYYFQKQSHALKVGSPASAFGTPKQNQRGQAYESLLLNDKLAGV